MSQQQEAVATQQGADANEQAEQPKSRRELAMEAIADARSQQINEELGIAVEPVAAQTESEDQIAAQLSDDVIDNVSNKRVKVKIDGVEQEIPLEDVLRNYQKGSAADRRLEEATRLLKEAKAQAVIEPQQEQAVTPPSAGPDELKLAVKTALAKVFEGDEEAAADALTKVLAQQMLSQPAQAPQQNLDINVLAEQLQQRMDVKSAIDKVRTDYPEIISDPDLDQLTYLKVQHKEEAGIPRAQALLEAAAEVYQKMGKKSGRQGESSESALREQKLARKAATDPVPVAHAAAATIPQADASPSAVIAEMAARRLGQSLPRR